jgi:predicted metalloprotease with PDZ domain
MTHRLSFIAALLTLASTTFAKPALLEIDATQADRRIFHSHLVLPISPGAATLYFPKWLPGAHTPSGAVNSMVGLKITAAGKPIAWHRDDIEMFSFHCEVPADASELDINLDFISPIMESKGFTDRFTTAGTPNIALINWESMLLYPKGQKVDDLIYQAHLRLPKNWDFATALTIAKRDDQSIEFKPVSLVTLIDSPLISGRYLTRFPLGEVDGAKHEIDAVAESAAALEMPPETLTAYKSLPIEAHALFASRHYQKYNFLLTLSDPLKAGGWEHHESSDNRASEKFLADETERLADAGLLPHEFVHSWNGKFRRPIGLATPDYQEPMKGELLWVYEGLTQYLGNVLTARSGLVTYDQARQALAVNAAFLEQTPGRAWRSLADTAVAAQLTYDSPHEWNSLRRGTDFYNEGALIWLEADILIRQQSQGKKSLDDFCKAFFSGGNGNPEVKTYTLEDLIAALDSVSHSEWKQFFADRVYATTQHAPLGGIENGGWKLAFGDEPTAVQKAWDGNDKSVDLVFSLGLAIGENGRIGDVIPASPADKAGLAPGQKIVAVNTRKYSDDLIRDVVKHSAKTPDPIELIVENEEFMKVFHIDYHDGLRYARLDRDPAKPDLLQEILKPHTTHPATAPATKPTP